MRHATLENEIAIVESAAAQLALYDGFHPDLPSRVEADDESVTLVLTEVAGLDQSRVEAYKRAIVHATDASRGERRLEVVVDADASPLDLAAHFEKRVRAMPGTPAAVETEWDFDTQGPILHLSVYLSVRLCSEACVVPRHLASAHTFESDHVEHVARRLAERLSVPLNIRSKDDEGDEEASWSATLPPRPARTIRVEYLVAAWFEDGRVRRERGSTDVVASSVPEAIDLAIEQVGQRTVESGAALVRVTDGEGYLEPDWYELGPLSRRQVDQAKRDALCDAASRGASLASTLRDARFATALEAMTTLMQAFSHTDPTAFQPVAHWYEGALDDAALDATLAPALERTRLRWDAVNLMRSHREAGERPSTFLRSFCAAMGSLGASHAWDRADLRTSESFQTVLGWRRGNLSDDELDDALMGTEGHGGERPKDP